MPNNNPSTVKRVKKLRFLVSAIFISWLMAQCALLLYWWTWWHAAPSSSSSSSYYHDYHNSHDHPNYLKDADGWINGIIPLQLVVTTHHEPPLSSSIHCVGENFQNNSWWYKSCHFTNLCYHIPTKEFHLLLEENEEQQDDGMAAWWWNESNYLTKGPSVTVRRRGRLIPWPISRTKPSLHPVTRSSITEMIAIQEDL